MSLLCFKIYNISIFFPKRWYKFTLCRGDDISIVFTMDILWVYCMPRYNISLLCAKHTIFVYSMLKTQYQCTVCQRHNISLLYANFTKHFVRWALQHSLNHWFQHSLLCICENVFSANKKVPSNIFSYFIKCIIISGIF